MQLAWPHADRMHIQIRNVPEGIHRQLKAKAALEGKTLSDFLLEELEKLAGRPTQAEVFERIAKLPKVESDVSAADIIREMRGPIP